MLYHRRIPRREHGHRIDVASKQLIGGLLGRERKQLAHILIDIIALEQLEQKRMRAVADRSDRDLPTAQGGQCLALQAAAMEDPQRLVEQRSKRFELARCLADAAALHQRDIHAGVRISQQRQVLHAACRFDQPELHAGAGEQLLILFADLVVTAALGPGRHRDRTGRHGAQQKDRGVNNGTRGHGDRDHVQVRP